MQTTGYVIVNGRKILVLVRHKRHSRQMRMRQSGRDGTRFEDEERFLALPENERMLQSLLQGKTVEL